MEASVSLIGKPSLWTIQVAQNQVRGDDPDQGTGVEEPKKKLNLENRGLPNKIGIDFALSTGFAADSKYETDFFKGTILRSLGLGPTMDIGVDFAGQFWTSGVPPFTVNWDARFGYHKVEDFNESFNARYHYKALSPYPSWCPVALEQTFEYNGTNLFGLNITPNEVKTPDEWISRTNPMITDQVRTDLSLTFLPLGGKLRPSVGFYALGGNEKWFPGKNIDYQFRGEADIWVGLAGTYSGWDISGQGSIMGREGTKLIVKSGTTPGAVPDFNPIGDLNDAIWRPMSIYKFMVSTPEFRDIDLTIDGQYKTYGGVTPVNQWSIGVEADITRKYGWVNETVVRAEYLSNPVLYVGDNTAWSIEGKFLVDPAAQLGLKRVESPAWLTVKYMNVGFTSMVIAGVEVDTDFLGGGLKSRRTQVNPK